MNYSNAINSSMTDYKKTQKELTELNDDSNENKSQETELSKKEEIIKKRLEELRKRDPFIYR